MQQAFNTLARFDDRAEADILGALVKLLVSCLTILRTQGQLREMVRTALQRPMVVRTIGGAIGVSAPGVHGTPLGVLSSPPQPLPPPILHASFLQWLEEYQGQPFNMLHCDFPYGVNLSAARERPQYLEHLR